MQISNNETTDLGKAEAQQSPNLEQTSKRPYPKLDYTITDPQERNRKVHQIINSIDQSKLTPYYMEELTKYLTETPDTKKAKQVLTDNRMITVNKRETSYQGLVSRLESGEDAIYNFMTGGDKNILLVPKIEITEEDIETVPGLRELREEIRKVQIRRTAARGKARYLLTKQLIEMRQDQYVLKYSYKQPLSSTKLTKSLNQIDLNESISVDEKGDPVSNGLVSLFNPNCVCAILCNYSKLKEEAWGHFDGDWWYLMEDFDNLVERALKEDYPILYDILVYKIDGIQNKDIVVKLKETYDTTYSIEYLSAIWRKKIPKIIADKAKEEWIVWHYTMEEKGQWKRCSRCHEVKLAHPYFFTRNRSAKDGWYSMCKCCRNKKNK